MTPPATTLGEHAAAGRLSTEEFNDRMDTAYKARTQGELAALLRDLPPIASGGAGANAAVRTEGQERARRNFMRNVVGWVVLSAMLTVIWAAASSGAPFWPVFPIAIFGAGLARQAWRVYGEHGEDTEEHDRHSRHEQHWEHRREHRHRGDLRGDGRDS